MLFRTALIVCSMFLLLAVALSADRGKAPIVSKNVPTQADSTPAGAMPVVNVKDYGAIADGASHPLRSRYSTLAAARAVFPDAPSLAQEVDYAAVKAASNAALGPDGAEHGIANKSLNKPIFLPAGTYVFGDDTWTIRNAVGIHIYGVGRLSTRLTSNNTVFRTDGLWYSHIEGVEFDSLTSAAVAAVDIDGNIPGHAYDTRGVQGNTFANCFFDGGGVAQYSLALCRQGFSGGQCSENLFLNDHWQANVQAGFYINGFNALQNTIVGGNFQGHQKHGLYLVAGSVYLFSVGFQSTYQYTQILNGGFDIDASSAGVYDRIIVDGCRTESLRFYNGAFSQYGILRGVQQRASVPAWSANTPVNANAVIIGETSAGERLFRVTTAGTTGGSQPIWRSTGTVVDGSVTWTETEFEVVHLVAGEISGSSFQIGNVTQGPGWQVSGALTLYRQKFADLDANSGASRRSPSTDGAEIYCTDCDTPATAGATCSSASDRAGAEAHKIRGGWKCF
jgi:hypothetical protein